MSHPDDTISLALHQSFAIPSDAGYLTITRKPMRAPEYFYAVFADSTLLATIGSLPRTYSLLFFALAKTLIHSSGHCALYHVDSLIEDTKLVKSTLYTATHALKKAGLIKKWKPGKYLLNPYMVWCYDQKHLLLARELWDHWDSTPDIERDAQLQVILGVRLTKKYGMP
jgi:hypothetical protein